MASSFSQIFSPQKSIAADTALKPAVMEALIAPIEFVTPAKPISSLLLIASKPASKVSFSISAEAAIVYVF